MQQSEIGLAPRPDPGLVEMAAPSAGSGLPSTTALVYGALFGAVLLSRSSGSARLPALRSGPGAISVALIAAGCGARIGLGAHWPSQVLASLALALASVGLVQVVLAAALEGGSPAARDGVAT